MDIKQTLRHFGLDDKEIAVYLAALELKDASLLRIAGRAKVKRTTTYAVAEDLVKKGLMGSYAVKAGKRFMANDPDILLSQGEQKLAELKEVIPELKSLSKSEDESFPKISYHEGKKGYLYIAEDSLKIHSETLHFIGSLTELDKIISDKYDWEYYVPTRMKRKIKIKMLIFQEDAEKIKEKQHTEELREFRILPNEFRFLPVKLVYQDKVAIFSSQKEKVCVLIESKEISKMELALFNFIWEKAEKI
ncbi:MAG: helix-turn-helix domain-containing protein [Parcubacteria group bacterium]